MEQSTATPVVAKKTRVLIDSRVVAEFIVSSWERYTREDGKLRVNTPEEDAKVLEKKAREFEAFVRDHRSQDPISLTVERQYEDRCSACNQAWEVDPETKACAYCGTSVEATV